MSPKGETVRDTRNLQIDVSSSKRAMDRISSTSSLVNHNRKNSIYHTISQEAYQRQENNLYCRNKKNWMKSNHSITQVPSKLFSFVSMPEKDKSQNTSSIGVENSSNNSIAAIKKINEVTLKFKIFLSADQMININKVICRYSSSNPKRKFT